MANYQACKPFPEGFDTPAYKLSVPVSSARFFCLSGGGPAGEALKVQFTSGLIDVVELGDKALIKGESNVRAFRARGLTAGKGKVGAVLASGQPYSAELDFEVVADTDGTGTKLTTAFSESRSFLRQAIQKLMDLNLRLGSMAMNLPVSLVGDDAATYDVVRRWLATPELTQPDRQTKANEAKMVVTKAIGLLTKNLNLKTSAGADPTVMRSPRGGFGLSYPNQPDLGLELCVHCFDTKGPNCRHDVVSHEFFHMIGVGHGEPVGGRPLDYAKRPLATILALNSADHLAQLVAELNTGKFDACTRDNE
jgi:hypothetical protein